MTPRRTFSAVPPKGSTLPFDADTRVGDAVPIPAGEGLRFWRVVTASHTRMVLRPCAPRDLVKLAADVAQQAATVRVPWWRRLEARGRRAWARAWRRGA